MDALAKVMAESHKKHASKAHWYVLCFAMDNEKQGKGYGRELMTFITSMADAANLPLYLETL